MNRELVFTLLFLGKLATVFQLESGFMDTNLCYYKESTYFLQETYVEFSCDLCNGTGHELLFGNVYTGCPEFDGCAG